MQPGDLANDPAFNPLGRDMFGDPIKPPKQRVLAQRWTFPPFSVLDARSGDWQERKRAWLALGIRSELGRGENIVPNGSVRPPEQDGAYQRGYGKTYRRGDGTEGGLSDRPAGHKPGLLGQSTSMSDALRGKGAYDDSKAPSKTRPPVQAAALRRRSPVIAHWLT